MELELRLGNTAYASIGLPSNAPYEPILADEANYAPPRYQSAYGPRVHSGTRT
jgi:hypothetical protein